MNQNNKIYIKIFILIFCVRLSTDLVAYTPYRSNHSLFSLIYNNSDSTKTELPLLTFHVGCALALPTTSIRLADDQSGGNIHFQNDLLHSRYTLVPKMNVMIALKNSYRFTSDVYFVLSSKSGTLGRDIHLGNHFFESGTKIHSRFNFFAGNLSYIQPLFKNKRYNFGALFGLAGAHAFIRLNNEVKNNSVERSLWFVNPIVGLDVFGYLIKKIFYRAALKFSASPFNKYTYSYFTFKTYIEYHFTKNIGLGFRIDYMNMSVKDIQQRQFKGRLNMNLPVISLVGVIRMF
ncbi:hypothetical protein MYP_4616 [Sporocytophaga myxococcoides]|uniref:Outer membrane protein beta-barrel domain-containing protein n=1 Tax=Sporocytophaga myxococcoides TaxID=153721 RepID=A0A098LK71_9BACT|nr:hypothetical protein [Sporocytophaga myxococcoides]GAL87386.1 hypothetical protein MYP_4616 [Sporocytophaga myxococcoides]